MKTRNVTSLVLGILCAGVLQAVPVVRQNSVSVVQDVNTRRVTIGYTLEDDPGIVTVDIRTNGVTIGTACIEPLSGDVHHIIQPGARQVFWQPDETWAAEDIPRIDITAVVTAWATNAPPDYMAIDLQKNQSWDNVFFYPDAASVPGGITNWMYKTTWLLMRRIHATDVRWTMGSPSGEFGRSEDETPHYVTLTSDYFIGIYPVTCKQFELGTGTSRAKYNAYGLSDGGPVDRTNYNGLRGSSYIWPDNGHDVADNSLIGKFRAKLGIDVDLPTEAQWEYACRAGTSTGLYTGKECTSTANNGCPNVNEIANNGGGLSDVGLLLPNAWGLYDMCGGYSEECLDWYGTPGAAAAMDPTGPSSGTKRVAKGGYYDSGANACRSAARRGHTPDMIQKTGAMGPNDLGFRLCCPVGLTN